MGYQLVIWEGEKPETDAAASDRCRELMDRYYVGEGFEPTPAIRQFVAALTEVWTDDPIDRAWDESPWKFPPIIDDASGPLLFLNMRFGIGEKAAFLIAEMAQERGLVTFDTYVEVMRPCPARVIDEWNSRAWAQTLTNLPPAPENVAGAVEAMGYHLIVWDGERPETNEAGQQVCQDITRRYGDEQVEPTPAICGFIEALRETWPDDPTDPRWDGSPWERPSISDGASGPALFVRLMPDVGVLASCVVADLAEKHGLITYDPQVAMLRPVSQEIVEEYERRWASALN